MKKILGRTATTGKGVGQVFLILLWLVIGAAGTALVLFLLELGAVFFYSIDWWVLGAILRVGQWFIGIPAALTLLIGIGFCLFQLMRAIFAGKAIE